MRCFTGNHLRIDLLRMSIKDQHVKSIASHTTLYLPIPVIPEMNALTTAITGPAVHQTKYIIYVPYCTWMVCGICLNARKKVKYKSIKHMAAKSQINACFGPATHFIQRTLSGTVIRHFIQKALSCTVIRHFIQRTLSVTVIRHFIQRALSGTVIRHFIQRALSGIVIRHTLHRTA